MGDANEQRDIVGSGRFGPAANDDLDVDYWPLFRSALVAALLTIGVQVWAAVWFGLQQGARVEIGLFWILPYLRIITTSIEVFDSVIRWSTLATTVVVVGFAVEAVVRQRRLQVQMGRAFGFLDLALLGLLHLWGERFAVAGASPTRLMLYVLLAGVLGFILSCFVVFDTYRERSSSTAGGEVDDKVSQPRPGVAAP